MAIRELTKDGKKVGYDVQVSLRHPFTKKRHFLRRRAANKWEATQLEITLRQELEKQLSGNPIPTWSALVGAYEEYCLVNKAASTRHNELSILGHHATPHLHSKIVNQITDSDIREILNRIDPSR
jgi:pseudouridine-5'-phosphate glycosidase